MCLLTFYHFSNRAFSGCGQLETIFLKTTAILDYDFGSAIVYYVNEWEYVDGIPTPII